MKERLVTVLDENGDIYVTDCKIRMRFSKELDGDVAVFWYDDFFREESGKTHIIPVDTILYQVDK